MTTLKDDAVEADTDRIERFLSVKEAAVCLGMSQAWVYNQLKADPDFPRPVKLSERRKAFMEDEIIAWQQHIKTSRRG